jgi:Na+/H+ antiporter NhaD/arsenite permease-like protein
LLRLALLALPLLGSPVPALAAASAEGIDLTSHPAAVTALVLFVVAYILVVFEESLHMRKSKPVILAAGLIWMLVALTYNQMGNLGYAEQAIEHDLIEFAELFLFLLAAMTYINTMEERGVFDLLRVWLVTRGFSLRQVFWITGSVAFTLSPVADNLTTALLMATVVIAVGGANSRFVALACLNIVVAANAGGAFSPFGDITTLMVWQAGLVQFQEFLVLFLPALANWVVTAGLLSLGIGPGKPDPVQDSARLKHGAWVVVALFGLTITMAVLSHNVLHMPPVIGMMTGLGLLKIFGYYLARRDRLSYARSLSVAGGDHRLADHAGPSGAASETAQFYDIYNNLRRAEWDTLMFFYGVILCVGGLGAFGYLANAAQFMYTDLGPTVANTLVGFASAIVDNIPVMFAVLEMDPHMSHGQWLLVTLTAGVGGSMLSIGSAAGVAVMGQARGVYTFMSHLRWSWAVLAGYGASIWLHLIINAGAFEGS